MRGDLDTIVLKALKKEPGERYATAAAFADDLDRYLRGDPVVARPDSAGYRLRKFAVKHRLAVGAAAAVVLALAAGLAVASWQLRVARAEKKRAEEVKEFVASIFRSADPYFTGEQQMKASQLLTLAKERIDREMASQPESSVELLAIVGEAQANLEEYDAARSTLQAALDLAARKLPEGDVHTSQALRAARNDSCERARVRPGETRARCSDSGAARLRPARSARTGECAADARLRRR